MAQFLHRLGMHAARRRWVFLAAWLLVVVVVVALVREFGANTSNNLELPGTDSQAASDLLADQFPPQQNGQNPIVFRTETGKVTAPANKSAIEAAHQTIVDIRYVHSARSPFSQKGASQVSDDKRTAFIPVLLEISNERLTEEKAQRILDAGDPAVEAGMKVAAAGQIGSELSEPATESSEVVGLATAMVILAFTFGTLAAMGLPIISAVIGLLIGLSIVGLLGHLTEVPTVAPTLATMIGLGVGIDYALFLVNRYRAHRAEGMETTDAIAITVATSGSAVVFAGSTVVLALVTLLVAGIPLVTSLGYASAVAVVTAVLAAITLLPAIFALLGRRIDSLSLPAFMRPEPKPQGQGVWASWARFVTGHPWRSVALALVILVPLIIPFLSLDLGQEDIGATPKDTTERQAYDLLASGFGVGYNGPLLVAVDLGSPAKPSNKFKKQKRQAEKLQSELEQEQQQGQAEAARLQSQGDALQAQQGELEGEQAALEGEAAGLEAERAQLESERAALDRQRTLRTQFDALVAQAEGLARETAELDAEAAAIRRELSAVHAAERRIEAELAGDLTPGRRERLESRLAALQAREAELVNRLEHVTQQQQRVQAQADSVRRQAADLRAQAEALGGAAVALGGEVASVALEAASLAQQKDALEQSAADAQIQAANLQAQKAQLEAEQQVAQIQEKQAKDLKRQLTNELTNAGGDERGTDPRLVKLQRGLRETTGVDLASPPQINKSGEAAIFTVIPTTAPAATETADLVETFRDYVIPQRLAGTDSNAHVGGQTASYVDLASGISSKLGLVIAAVIALGFTVLMTAFRSLLVPAQAAVANVLSVCAAFGVVTACFQYGWGLDLVGLDTASGTDPIASFVPLIMFAVLFGLSMDYQVFLMSQIEHARARIDDESKAVAIGLETGAKPIVAAALIMMSVFASFILNGDPTVKQFGVGLSVGVALAAMTVLLLAPALLVLAGRGSWWLPTWAEQHLPQIDIEGQRLEAPATASTRIPQPSLRRPGLESDP
jgi:uncharacterized membrane protein YdfJ with MMPL/SSD domain